MRSNPKVFISYSHDTPEHMDRVLTFSDRLRHDGVDCYIDQYVPSPPEGWPRWTGNQIEQADFVIVVCSQIYDRRFKGLEETGKGLGAKWEGAIITQELYDAEANNTKFIPVSFSSEDWIYIPTPLRGATRYELDKNYTDLYRILTDQPAVLTPELGNLRPMPPLERKRLQESVLSEARPAYEKSSAGMLLSSENDNERVPPQVASNRTMNNQGGITGVIPHHSLIRLLAELYDTQGTSRRVVDSIGLTSLHIKFQDDAIDNWHNVLAEAKKRGKVETVVDFVTEEYPERAQELRMALQAFSYNISPRESTIDLNPTYVSAPQQSKQPATGSPTRLWESTVVPSQQPQVQPPLKEQVKPANDDLIIGRDRHWDREEATADFLRMINTDGNGEGTRNREHVLVLQGVEAGLDSLVDRFEEMCEKVTTIRPLLYARINLGPIFIDYFDLVLQIVDKLRRCAKQKTLNDEWTKLGKAYDFVEETQSKSGFQAPSPQQFARHFTEEHLASLTSTCTVVLLLQGFDLLWNKSTDEWLSTSKWLKNTWLVQHASDEDGLVILLTGEKGLEDLRGQQFVSHHDLPPLNKEKLKEWATQSQHYGFSWFTDEEARIAY